jgi:hypothetical protein
MSHPKNAKREPLSAEERKRTLFIKGFTGRDIVELLEQRLGIKMSKNTLRVEQREGSRGATYTIVCSRQEEANAVLEKKRALKGTSIWVDRFKPRIEREIERNRAEYWKIMDTRTPKTMENMQRSAELQSHFLYLWRKFTVSE